MTDIQILTIFTILGLIFSAYLGTGFILMEFKGVELPLIARIYEISSIESKKSQKGKWMVFRGYRMCTSCKRVYTEDEWAKFWRIPDRCPECGSINEWW